MASCHFPAIILQLHAYAILSVGSGTYTLCAMKKHKLSDHMGSARATAFRLGYNRLHKARLRHSDVPRDEKPRPLTPAATPS